MRPSGINAEIAGRARVGDAAREPGDIDFVVLPASRSIRHFESVAMLDGIIDAVRSTPGAGLLADEVTAEDIWTYEPADGRRLVFPFAVDDLPRGAVQLDFVFSEVLPILPVPLAIPSVDRMLLAATPELSPAWKLLWLATDSHPQGKGLYDAVLLAERTAVPDRELGRRPPAARTRRRGRRFRGGIRSGLGRRLGQLPGRIPQHRRRRQGVDVASRPGARRGLERRTSGWLSRLTHSDSEVDASFFRCGGGRWVPSVSS